MITEQLKVGLRSGGRRMLATTGRHSAGARLTPSFLIVGAQRCGTTSLFRMLAEHPQVVTPMLNKGIHYFDTAERYAKGPEWYFGHFPLAGLAGMRTRQGRPITGEASPYYLFHPLAAERIGRALPGVAAVVLLRDPVERAFSAFKQERGRGFEHADFRTALSLERQRLAGEEERIRSDPRYQSFHHQHHAYLARGEYAGQIRRLQQHLGRERVLIFEMDELLAGDLAGWDRLTAGLDIAPWRPGRALQANTRPSRAIDDDLRKQLRTHFEAHDAALEVVLGRRPSWRA